MILILNTFQLSKYLIHFYLIFFLWKLGRFFSYLIQRAQATRIIINQASQLVKTNINSHKNFVPQ